MHIPFCASRCSYCDFYLVTRLDHREAFFRALSLETESRSADLKGKTISAIHFGGGTPSLVPVDYLSRWLDQIESLCIFAPDIEITLEANPEDLDDATMDELKAIGITRLSIGVQSFTDNKLRSLGRVHTAAVSQQVTVEALQRFESVSVDLICGVPGEHPEMWEADLKKAIALRPQHLSVYMLSIEPKTRLHWQISKGVLAVPDEEEQAGFYEAATRAMAVEGYSHYEVSNFCLPGHHSRYNLASWQRKPYLGFGPSAHSFLVSAEGELRMANVSSLTRYLAAPEQAVVFCEELTEAERTTEHVFLSLRINSGLDIEFLQKENKLGHRLAQCIDQYAEKGWIVLRDGHLFLTGKGFLFADFIAGEFISG